MRLRSPPPGGGGEEQGDVRLALTMNAVALQSLSTLASLATTIHSLPCERETGHSNVELIRAPFAMLADMLGEFPSQSLVRSPSGTYDATGHLEPLSRSRSHAAKVIALTCHQIIPALSQP